MDGVSSEVRTSPWPFGPRHKGFCLVCRGENPGRFRAWFEQRLLGEFRQEQAEPAMCRARRHEEMVRPVAKGQAARILQGIADRQRIWHSLMSDKKCYHLIYNE